MSVSFKHKLLLFFILFLGLFVRLMGNNWDQGWHLHPDERFLTMVSIDVKIPQNISKYLDQYTSTFNPVNKGHGFYVYGTFPLLINKALAQFLYNDTYELTNLQGRALSGIADFFVIYILYKIIELVENELKLAKSIKYSAAFLYAVAVLPIQLSHFFAVDTFLNLFCWASLYFAVRAYNTKHVTYNIQKSYMLHVTCYMCMSGLFFGLALACKISALYFAPITGIFVLLSLRLLVIPAKAGIQSKMSVIESKIRIWIPIFIAMTMFLIFCYLALRLGSPYYFQTNNIFNPQISAVFINNIKTLKSFENSQMLFPPANQWVSASPFLSIKNVFFFGVGPVYFIFSLIGFFLINIQKKLHIIHLVSLWVIGFTVYQSVQFAKTMRYLIFIYPFLAFFAAVGVQQITLKIHLLAFSIRLFIYSIICISILYWPLAFMSLYTKDHSRVSASKYMFQTLPKNSIILSEYWDDPLPLMVQNPVTRNFVGSEVHIFDPDTPGKWNIIDEQLKRGDYYVMSSNRGWGSIPTTPKKYPIASAFYTDMFAGKRGYIKYKEFTSYPSLRYLGIPFDFPDQWAEEAFTVYDHPLVKIFKKN